MKRVLAITFAAVLSAVSLSVQPCEIGSPTLRGTAARYAFARHNACPATGKFGLSCPGFVVDHIFPLCAGGPDSVANMQWQEIRESYQKDALERKLCRNLKKAA